MLAWWGHMMGAVDKAAGWIYTVAGSRKRDITAICGHTVTACGNPDNLFGNFHTAPCP